MTIFLLPIESRHEFEDEEFEEVREELCLNMFFEFLPASLLDEIDLRASLPEDLALSYFRYLSILFCFALPTETPRKRDTLKR